MDCRLHVYYRLVTAYLDPSDARREMILMDTDGSQELPLQPYLY